jgi:hypothetical protein
VKRLIALIALAGCSSTVVAQARIEPDVMIIDANGDEFGPAARPLSTVVLPPSTTTTVAPTTTTTTTLPPTTSTTTTSTTTTTVAPTTTLPPGGGFLETFEGAPTVAAPWQPTNWGVDANNSDMWAGDGLGMDTMAAHHGSDCSAPPATHTVSRLDQAVFLCRNHVMTSVSGGYAAAYLTPPAMVDFRNGEAIVRFDMSTARGSGRDWVDLWITPPGDQLALPLNAWLPPYNGEPQNAVQIKMEGGSRFEAYQYTPTRRSSNAKLPVASTATYESWLTPAADVRSVFELRISRTHVKFCMPDFGRCWVNTAFPSPLTWDVGVVQLGHHSYNATKDCSGACVNTWHWDNVNINPSVPLNIVPPSPRWAVATSNSRTIQLQRPAPAGGSLRFAAVGMIQVSFNGGQTYTPAVRRSLDRRAPEHFSSYLQPIPAGTTSITFQGSADQYIGRWMVSNVNVVAG